LQNWQVLAANLGNVTALVFTPDRKLVSSGGDGSIHVLDPRTGQKELLGSHALPVRALALALDGRRLVSCDRRLAMVWDLKSCSVLHSYPRRQIAFDQDSDGLAFTPDGEQLLASGPGGLVQLWNARSKQTMGVLRGHDDHVQTLAIHPDGDRIVTASRDRTVRIWHADRREELLTLGNLGDPATAMAFAPNGDRLAIGFYNGKLRLLSAELPNSYE
jgi:WD40 repeat protein